MNWSLVIITGASRGLGQAIALSLARKLDKPTHFIIHGRDIELLHRTSEEIKLIRNDKAHHTDITIAQSDLGSLDTLESSIANLFDFPSTRDYSELTFFNNAGSLGPLSFIGTSSLSLPKMIDAFNLNVTASSFLTSELIKRARDSTYFPSCKKFFIVNISSLAAIQPFESWSIYCAGKAARDMFHKVLSQELLKSTEDLNNRDIKILNYAPGPLDTDMQKEIREGPDVDKPTREYFIELKANNQLVTPAQSSDKLIDYLYTKQFINGDHVDYYDI